MTRNNNTYQIVVHRGMLASTTLIELQCWSSLREKWITACASSFEADIKHYCQDVDAMNVYNDRSSWIHRKWTE